MSLTSKWGRDLPALDLCLISVSFTGKQAFGPKKYFKQIPNDLNIFNADYLTLQEFWFRYFAMLSKNYDPEFGGYSRAPKFPQPSNLKTMFR